MEPVQRKDPGACQLSGWQAKAGLDILKRNKHVTTHQNLQGCLNNMQVLSTPQHGDLQSTST
eukprot:651215-Pelagomonas_calceolata.AAC.4